MEVVGGCWAYQRAEGVTLIDMGTRGVVAVPGDDGGGAGPRGLLPALVGPHMARMRLNHITGWRPQPAGGVG